MLVDIQVVHFTLASLVKYVILAFELVNTSSLMLALVLMEHLMIIRTFSYNLDRCKILKSHLLGLYLL